MDFNKLNFQYWGNFTVDKDLLKFVAVEVARIYYMHLLIEYVGIPSGTKLSLCGTEIILSIILEGAVNM